MSRRTNLDHFRDTVRETGKLWIIWPLADIITCVTQAQYARFTADELQGCLVACTEAAAHRVADRRRAN